MNATEALTVLAAAVATALATGLGAAPFLVASRVSREWIGSANAVAGGFMLAASVLLLATGARENVASTVVGAAAGVVFVAWASRMLRAREHVRFAALGGTDARTALLLVGVMTAHSFAEGIGVGVAFAGGEGVGLVTAAAIAIHNIPEGLAISLVLVPRGVRAIRAAAWSVVSSLPQPAVAVPAFLFVAVFDALVPVGLGFAGGAMVWMVAAAIVPDALRTSSRRTVALALGVSTAAMLAIEAFLVL